MSRMANNHVLVTPARRRHQWGGVATVRDVCVRCNNGPLSVLDDFSLRIVEAAKGAVPTLSAEEGILLARWGGKVAYNIQRLCFEEGTQGSEPRLPQGAVKLDS